MAVKTEFKQVTVTISHLDHVIKHSFKKRKDSISHLNVIIRKKNQQTFQQPKVFIKKLVLYR